MKAFFLIFFYTVFLMILKRDGDRRVHERPHNMLEDDDYDKKS
jgi:hypothetical protein